MQAQANKVLSINLLPNTFGALQAAYLQFHLHKKERYGRHKNKTILNSNNRLYQIVL